MAKKMRLANPLALAVLALLFERPMHPYEMAVTLKDRHKEESIKLRYGSLYTVIDLLLARGFIAAKATSREGKRPERTVYALTAAGLDELRDWLRELLRDPAKEYPQFEGALCLMTVLPPDEAVTLLRHRALQRESAARPLILRVEAVVTRAVALNVRADAHRELRGRAVVERVAQLVVDVLDLPVDLVSRRPRLIAERQTLIFGGKLLHQLGRCSPGVLDLAEKPNLARPPGLRDRNRITQLRGIESHESFAMIAHDSPSLFEALPGPSG